MTRLAKRLDLLILDLDGTLVDSEAILVGLVNQTLRALGHAPSPARAVAATIGLPLDEVFRRALPDAGEETVATLCHAFRRRADTAEFVRQFRLYPGVSETLAALRASGARLVVGTSKGRATTLDILRHCGVAGLIDEVIGGDCVTQGKPHPEMVERARLLYGAASERALMVGDTPFDITMGQAAAVSTCAVTYGMHPAAALRALNPDFVIDRFPDLLGCV
jgi:phosphoglycolate phosphatase